MQLQTKFSEQFHVVFRTTFSERWHVAHKALMLNPIRAVSGLPQPTIKETESKNKETELHTSRGAVALSLA